MVYKSLYIIIIGYCKTKTIFQDIGFFFYKRYMPNYKDSANSNILSKSYMSTLLGIERENKDLCITIYEFPKISVEISTNILK